MYSLREDIQKMKVKKLLFAIIAHQKKKKMKKNTALFFKIFVKEKMEGVATIFSCIFKSCYLKGHKLSYLGCNGLKSAIH